MKWPALSRWGAGKLLSLSAEGTSAPEFHQIGRQSGWFSPPIVWTSKFINEFATVGPAAPRADARRLSRRQAEIAGAMGSQNQRRTQLQLGSRIAMPPS